MRRHVLPRDLHRGLHRRPSVHVHNLYRHTHVPIAAIADVAEETRAADEVHPTTTTGQRVAERISPNPVISG
jgi:hypothetical protein